LTMIRSFPKWKFAIFRNEKGFTLIEALLALSIFSTIAFFFAPLLQILLNDKAVDGEYQKMEWEVFCSQIKKEIRMSSSVEVISGRLILTIDMNTIQYEKYGSNLRRRVNNTGNETLLQNVSNVSFSLQKNAVIFTVKDTWGENYSLTAYSYFDWNSPS
jgi:competence protein ComGF